MDQAVTLAPVKTRTGPIQTRLLSTAIYVQSTALVREDEDGVPSEGYRAIDRMREAVSAEATGGLSPGTLALALFDWLIHHAIAFAPKADLHGRLADCSRDGFLDAMDVSCHSFIRMARLAEPLMTSGAALESAVRYLAYEFGPKGFRIHAISPGRMKTRAASGLDHFDDLLFWRLNTLS